MLFMDIRPAIIFAIYLFVSKIGTTLVLKILFTVDIKKLFVFYSA